MLKKSVIDVYAKKECASVKEKCDGCVCKKKCASVKDMCDEVSL